MTKYMLCVFAVLSVFLLSSCAGAGSAGSSNDAYIWRDDLTTEAEVRAEFARIKADVYSEWTRENEQICQRVLQEIAHKVNYDVYGSGAMQKNLEYAMENYSVLTESLSGVDVLTFLHYTGIARGEEYGISTRYSEDRLYGFIHMQAEYDPFDVSRRGILKERLCEALKENGLGDRAS